MGEIGQDIARAKELLLTNNVVGIPTETVYGLGGNALNEDAILKIYEIKKRPRFDPLIAHTDSLDKVKALVKDIPKKAIQLIAQFWPGPLTLLLNKRSIVPDLLTSGQARVAVRIPDHPLTLELLGELDFPLAAPSANPFQYVSPTTIQHVSSQLGDKIPYILDGGECRVGVESTIVGFEKGIPIIYRFGGISVESIEEMVGQLAIKINSSSDPAAPGMLKSHYSPGKAIIVGNISENLKWMDVATTGVVSFREEYDVPFDHRFILSPSGSLHEAARNIFKALRKMDNPQINQVLAEFVPDYGLGKAINDRLKRAATV